MISMDCYNNSIAELDILYQRLELIKINEKKLLNEKRTIGKTIEKYKEKTSQIRKLLSDLDGIEYELFYEIVINGLNVSKAVEKIAEQNEKDISTIWKNYYPKVKNYIK